MAEARHKITNKKVAVKVINAENMKQYGQLILEEARVYLQLKHKNIVKCYEVFKQTSSEDSLRMVMELMDMDMLQVL